MTSLCPSHARNKCQQTNSAIPMSRPINCAEVQVPIFPGSLLVHLFRRSRLFLGNLIQMSARGRPLISFPAEMTIISLRISECAELICLA